MKIIIRLKKKLNIVLFAYSFPHRKTADFITKLCENRFNLSLILAANYVKIKKPKSAVVFTKKEIKSTTKELANKYKIPCYIVPHNSVDVLLLLKQYKINFGVISGARILKADIIKSIKYGILNLHPALLPFIRGLDSILWSIYKNYPLGVTAHLIDEKIDAGHLVCEDKVSISRHDSLESLYEKNYQLQLRLLKISLDLIIEKNSFRPLAIGQYNQMMPYKQQLLVISKVNEYINCHVSNERGKN